MDVRYVEEFAVLGKVEKVVEDARDGFEIYASEIMRSIKEREWGLDVRTLRQGFFMSFFRFTHLTATNWIVACIPDSMYQNIPPALLALYKTFITFSAFKIVLRWWRR